MRKISEHQIERADKIFRGRMSVTPFLNHPGFKYSFKTRSYRDFTFGAVTGPAIHISNLFHEMAHAIEFVLSGEAVDRRCEDGKFEFWVKKIELGGRYYNGLETIQCTEREIRTWAIQLKFMHIVGFKHDPQKFAKEAGELSTWLPDDININVLKGTKGEAERKAWVSEQVLKHYQTLDKDQMFGAFLVWLDETHKMQTQSAAVLS